MRGIGVLGVDRPYRLRRSQRETRAEVLRDDHAGHDADVEASPRDEEIAHRVEVVRPAEREAVLDRIAASAGRCENRARVLLAPGAARFGAALALPVTSVMRSTVTSWRWPRVRR